MQRQFCEQDLITGMARAHHTALEMLNRSVNKVRHQLSFITQLRHNLQSCTDVMLSGDGGLWSGRLPPEVRGPGRCVVRLPGHIPPLGQPGRGGGGVQQPGGRDHRGLGRRQAHTRMRRAGLHPVRPELHHHGHDRGDTPGEPVSQ